MKNFYVTTPIYFPNANPHLGTAYCTIMADILARYHRLKKDDTYFLTGTDEHGLKIFEKAKQAHKTPQEFVDEIAVNFKKLWKTLSISNDDFIRTTETRHMKVAQSIFSKLLKNDDIYLGHYEGWYCVPCESFWTNTQVGEARICPECGRPVITAKEETYFFRTNKYLEQLKAHFEKHPDFLLPINRKNEMFNTFINQGLNDLSVSRTSFTWGVPILENPQHVMYVWIDALANYISALGYDSIDDQKFIKFWEQGEVVHLLGADITRFHAIYWPMILMALGLKVPNRLFVHGLIMTKDGKMSKSKGNTIDPFGLINLYGADVLRYYCAREIKFGEDGVFTPEQFIERTNADLVNNYGNLVNRTLSMINKYYDGIIPDFVSGVNKEDASLEKRCLDVIKEVDSLMEELKITEALGVILELVDMANKYIELTTPWILAKEQRHEALKSVMAHLAHVIYVATMLLSPVLVTTHAAALDQLGVDATIRDYAKLSQFGVLNQGKIVGPTPLLPRLDVTKEVERIKEIIK
ncbi:MAG: methionine--tRNA ligase [Erysipelotrichaceae bacterium]|jgi:methionyl-tRNA synthetase|nr:methionine--tRNA ligase [Erysipelotrichaceae bacterium]